MTRTVVFWPGETIGGSNWNEKGADHGVEIDTGTFKSAFSAPRILTEMAAGTPIRMMTMMEMELTILQTISP